MYRHSASDNACSFRVIKQQGIPTNFLALSCVDVSGKNYKNDAID